MAVARWTFPCPGIRHVYVTANDHYAVVRASTDGRCVGRQTIRFQYIIYVIPLLGEVYITLKW